MVRTEQPVLEMIIGRAKLGKIDHVRCPSMCKSRAPVSDQSGANALESRFGVI